MTDFYKPENGEQGDPVSAGVTVREDLVQNGVAFLSHPKVRSSPAASKRSFLEQKGLTSNEIDEAFRRAPEIREAEVPQIASQPSTKPSAVEQRPVQWGQVALGVGFAATGAYAFKSVVWPYVADTLKSWRRSDSNATTPVITETDRESNAAQAIANAVKLQTEELGLAVASIKSLVEKLEKGKLPAEDLETVTISDLRHELRSFASTLNEIAKPSKSTTALETELADIKALLNDYLRTPRSGSATPQDMPTPGSLLPGHSADISMANGNSQDRHPPSYMEVLEMLEKGQTPPGIRTDINDKPPNPKQPPNESRLKPRPKPWERSGSSEGSADETPTFGSISFENTDVKGEHSNSGSPFSAPRQQPSSIYEALSPSADLPGTIADRLSPDKPQQPYGSLGRPTSKGWKPPPMPQPSLGATGSTQSFSG